MELPSRLFRGLVEECGLPLALAGADGRYLWANRWFIDGFGLDGRFAPGCSDAELFHPDTAAALAGLGARVTAGGVPAQDEVAVMMDGDRHVFVVTRFPLEGGVGTAALDITLRSRAQDDITASRALFKDILNIAADAVISVDESQRILLFNQGAERIFGYRADEVAGKPLALLLPPAARPAHGGHVAEFRKAPERARQMGERGQIYGCRKNGEVFPAEASISRIDTGGRLTFTAILRDVTRQREAEAAIEALNRDLSLRATQLENANRELEAFSYSVSHDLRAPLRGIDGFSLVLLEDYGDDLPAGARNALDRVRAATQRMGQLIDDMLNLSRLTRGELHRETVDLTAMAEAIAADLKRSGPERDVIFVIAGGLAAHADPHLVRVVLGNLMDNAWKYTSKHPSARIEVGRTTAEDGRPAFFVRDDGAGFDMAYVHKLFGAFQRLHGMNEYPGTGIGLATVQRIIHKHGGEVWAEGAVEKGATVTFTLE